MKSIMLHLLYFTVSAAILALWVVVIYVALLVTGGR